MCNAAAAARLSSFFEKPKQSRVNRRMKVRIVRLQRSTCDVHIVARSRMPRMLIRSAFTIVGGSHRTG